jgi:hypothetical protein
VNRILTCYSHTPRTHLLAQSGQHFSLFLQAETAVSTASSPFRLQPDLRTQQARILSAA